MKKDIKNKKDIKKTARFFSITSAFEFNETSPKKLIAVAAVPV
jgi:hypothetical protein